MADLVTLIRVTPLKRQYPHLDQVAEWSTRQTLHLLWERVFSLEERLRAVEANVILIGAAVNTLNTTVLSVQQLAQQAFALAQSPSTSPVLPGVPPTGGEDCPDDGQAAAGVADAGPNGDVGVVPLDAYNAGRIIGGTAHEYPLLLAPTMDEATREANNEELVLRMIWHLNQAGFVAGRQRNPSSAISKDKITIEIGGTTFAYDVFQGVNFTEATPVQAFRVCPADYVAAPGTPD